MSEPAILQFFALGEPKGQPRPRAWAMKVGCNADGSAKYQARMYEAGSAENWKAAVATAAKPHAPFIPLLGPISVDITFHFPRPRSHYRSGKLAGQLQSWAPTYHEGRPDRDNLDKCVLDVLKTLGFFRDDGQVCEGQISKVYATDKPGALITVKALSPQVEPVKQRRLALV